ncbi:alkaline phosphatase family protein [Desulfonatronum parangueonense]
MPNKCLLIVLDGLGDRSHEVLGWQTPLQSAHTPHLDRLTRNGANGLYHAGSMGEALPSETAHFAMFGYDRKDFPGRGPLEALGAGVVPGEDDVVVLAHFATLEERDGCLTLVRDVPPADEGEISTLIQAVGRWEQDGVRIRYVPVKGVFGVLILSGDVSPDITDTGPMRDGRLLPDLLPLDAHHPERADTGSTTRARNTARALRAYLLHAWHTLRAHSLNARRKQDGLPLITGLVTQRAGRLRPVQPFSRRFGLRGLSIASGAVFRGLARYLGLDWQASRDTGDLTADFARDLTAALELFTHNDFIHLHTKAPDEAAHARDPQRKKAVIEALDRALGRTEKELSAHPDLLTVVTADHSTPSSGNMIHSGEPVPLLMHGTGVRRDLVDRFNEIHAAQGCLGGVRGTELMRLILNHLDMARLEGIRDTPEDCLYWPGNYQPLRLR